MIWQLSIVFVTFVTFYEVIYGSNDLISEPVVRLQTTNNFHHIHDHMRLNDSLHSWTKSVSLSTCQNYSDKYAAKAAEFTNCSIEYASPFRVCEKCVEQYMEVDEIYNDIDQMDKSQNNCKTILLDSSRIHILKNFHESIKRIWSSSYCRKCFDNITVTNNVVHYTLTSEAIYLKQLYDNITDCFNVPHQNGTNACGACQQFYESLLLEFRRISEDWKNIEICMDLIDMMNSTKVYWGATLKCTEMHKIYYKEFVLAVILILSPVVFYVGFAVYGTKKEQKQIMKLKRLSQRKLNYGSLKKNECVSTQSEILPQSLSTPTQDSMSSIDSMNQNIIANGAMDTNGANRKSSQK